MRPCVSFGIPTKAEAGLLCWSCWIKLRDGLAKITPLVAHMRSIESSATVDANTKVAGSFGSRWPLSESHILANDVYTCLAACAIAYSVEWPVTDFKTKKSIAREPDWPDTSIADPDAGFGSNVTIEQVYVLTDDLVKWLSVRLEQLIAKPIGAYRSTELIRAMRDAFRKFSMTEDPHDIPYMRCQNCGHAQLRWEPPINQEGDVKITCERCGHAHTHDWYDGYLAEITMNR